MTKYQRGIEFIALNDDPGSTDAENVSVVQEMISVITMSEIFLIDPIKIAEDVIKFRKKYQEDQL